MYDIAILATRMTTMEHKKRRVPTLLVSFIILLNKMKSWVPVKFLHHLPLPLFLQRCIWTKKLNSVFLVQNFYSFYIKATEVNALWL